MAFRLPPVGVRTVLWWSAAVVALLAPRFFVDVSLAAIGPSADVRSAVGQFFAAYEAVLPFVLVPVVVCTVGAAPRRPRAWVILSYLVLEGLVVAIGTAVLLSVDSPGVRSLFPVAAVAGTAAGSGLALATFGDLRELVRRWWGGAFLALLLIIPAVVAMRAAVPLGIGTAPGEGGMLEGNWALVNAPTLLLELLSIGVWLNLVLGSPDGLRRWRPFIPFLAVPVAAAAFVAATLPRTILSATVSWGANLAVFVPPEASLTLVVASLACWASAFLLVRRRGRRDPWDLLFLGSVTLLLGGFHTTAASVAALNLGLILVAIGLARWPRPGS